MLDERFTWDESDITIIPAPDDEPAQLSDDEWESPYAEPRTFMAQGQPRASDGKWTGAGGHGGASDGGGALSDSQLSGIAAMGGGEWMQNNDAQLEAMAKAAGFDGKPHIGSVDAIVAAGGTEVRRGVSEKRFAEEFKTGDYFAGKGIHGNGTYAAGLSKLGDADSHSSGGGGAVMRIGIPKGAKVASEKDVEDLMARQDAHHTGEVRKMLGKDPGKAALQAGYDVIHIERRDFYVILNRSILTVEA